MAYSNGYESFYEGTPSSLSPDYGNFIGYRMNGSQLGFNGSPQTANQLGEAVNALKQGVKAFEVELLMPDVAEAFPKQHVNEIRALMKLSGVKPSVHAPLLDPAGFGEKGWSEQTREDNERRLLHTIEKVRDLDKSGNLPIVIHSANGAPGNEYVLGDTEKGEDRFKKYQIPIVHRETGQIQAVKEHRTYYLHSPEKFDEGGSLMTAKDAIKNRNATEWEERLKNVVADKSRVDRALMGLMNNTENQIVSNYLIKDTRSLKEYESIIQHENPLLPVELKKVEVVLNNNQLSFHSLFDNAYRFGTPDQKKELKNLASKWKEENEKLENSYRKNGFNPVLRTIDSARLQDQFFNEFAGITSKKAPEVYTDAESFAKEKASETFGNLAIESYKKWENGSPVLAIENLYQGMAFSKADDLKDLVDKSRGRFEKYLIEEKGLSKSDAERVAEKKIGVTWDVGHLNMMKKKGFTDKDVLKETSKIKDYVKHIHLTDNFGFGDSHLAPGMGNVPFKEILKELEKNGEFGKMRKIVEAGGMVQHFKKSPHPWVLGAFGSPIYGAKMGPYWNQAMDVQGSYFGGYGNINPGQHHSMYGAGFTTMPVELGGQMPGGNSRFDGRPMA